MTPIPSAIYLLHPTAPAIEARDMNWNIPNAAVIAGWQVVKSSFEPTRLDGRCVPCGRPPLPPPWEVDPEPEERSGSGRLEMSKFSMMIRWHSAIARVPENATRPAKKTGITRCIGGPVADIVKARLAAGTRKILMKKTARYGC